MSDLHTPPLSRKLGKSDITVSSMSWGMWRFGQQEGDAARSLIEAVLETGVTLFDTADIYRPDGQPFGTAERVLGDVFAASPSLRDKMVLATKGGIDFGTYDSSAEYLESAIDGSLARLRTDYVDLWQVHRPDILTHPAEIASVLQRAYEAGKIRSVGVSNFTTEQTRALLAFLDLPLVSHQVEFSPLALDPIVDGVLDQAMEHDLAVLCWSPLGGGRLGSPQDDRSKTVAAALDGVTTRKCWICPTFENVW
ncbi:aldo/keto reductase [Ochrobactrum sp. A-1]|uniref:aldo/keto reductase n=1 Tax=Ochrobactrum sp. A-1 TaxID=2920940 RepID=UPI001F0A2C5D|nr:aldo/keto reductase [Ochrobactrum sp. A-1]